MTNASGQAWESTVQVWGGQQSQATCHICSWGPSQWNRKKGWHRFLGKWPTPSHLCTPSEPHTHAHMHRLKHVYLQMH